MYNGRQTGDIINTVRRTTLTAATCAALALTGLAACGTVKSLSAAQKIQNASEKLGEQRSLKVELGLDADPKVLEAAAASDSPEDAMPPQAAKTLAHLRVSLSVEASKPLAKAEEKDFKAMAMTVGSGKGADLVEVRMIDKTVYLKADVDALGKALGTPIPGAGAGAGELPPELGSLKDLFAGRWVRTDVDSAEAAAGGKGKGGKDGENAEKLDSRTQRKLQTDLKAIVARRVTFTDQGEKDGAEHILAKASARDLLSDVFGALRNVSDELPPQLSKGLPTEKDLKDAPKRKIGVDFALKDGALSGITFDATQLAEPGDPVKKGDKFDIVLGFGKAGKITAPAGATELPKGDDGSFMVKPDSLFGGPGTAEDASADLSPLDGPDDDALSDDPTYRKAFEQELRKEMKKEFGADYDKGPLGDEIEKQIQEQLKEEFGDGATGKGALKS
ncbi:hypothetical protein AB0J21_18040 [Streptomyces sp. NPDC049954]|uniref:hypothetical protein n=1 Tax=Streptomyces sp. NPDC049954 TaxID=3155779 RepID=UPI00342F7637